MKRTLLGLAPLTLALAMYGVGCGGDDDPGTEAGETGDGDGDPTTGDGDGDPTTGDGDGDPTTTGDGDGDPTTTGDPVDTDNDGVSDDEDNCPDVANPNQLDFDGNGAGNVCDVQMFSMAGGTLNTTAEADSALGGCTIPLEVMVEAGSVAIQLDDDAAVAKFEITELQIADIPEQQCTIAGQTVTVSMKDFTMTNLGDPFPVSVAHNQAAHDGGSIAGDSDIPHPMLSTATLSASVGGDPPMDSDLMLEGAVPIFTANISNAGANGTLAWADGQFVLAMDTFMVEVPILGMVDIDFQLVGLIGSVTLAP